MAMKKKIVPPRIKYGQSDIAGHINEVDDMVQDVKAMATERDYDEYVGKVKAIKNRYENPKLADLLRIEPLEDFLRTSFLNAGPAKMKTPEFLEWAKDHRYINIIGKFLKDNEKDEEEKSKFDAIRKQIGATDKKQEEEEKFVEPKSSLTKKSFISKGSMASGGWFSPAEDNEDLDFNIGSIGPDGKLTEEQIKQIDERKQIPSNAPVSKSEIRANMNLRSNVRTGNIEKIAQERQMLKAANLEGLQGDLGGLFEMQEEMQDPPTFRPQEQPLEVFGVEPEPEQQQQQQQQEEQQQQPAEEFFPHDRPQQEDPQEIVPPNKVATKQNRKEMLARHLNNFYIPTKGNDIYGGDQQVGVSNTLPSFFKSGINSNVVPDYVLGPDGLVQKSGLQDYRERMREINKTAMMNRFNGNPYAMTPQDMYSKVMGQVLVPKMKGMGGFGSKDSDETLEDTFNLDIKGDASIIEAFVGKLKFDTGFDMGEKNNLVLDLMDYFWYLAGGNPALQRKLIDLIRSVKAEGGTPSAVDTFSHAFTSYADEGLKNRKSKVGAYSMLNSMMKTLVEQSTSVDDAVASMQSIMQLVNFHDDTTEQMLLSLFVATTKAFGKTQMSDIIKKVVTPFQLRTNQKFGLNSERVGMILQKLKSKIKSMKLPYNISDNGMII
jgi:hypothetical protein